MNVRDLVAREGPLSVEEVIKYALQVAEDLASRRGAVHGDIKPSNVLVTPEGRARLVDVALHQPSNDDLPANGLTLDTFDYISPEQARDPRDSDVRSDLYSLGCTMYYMLTSMPPFPEGTAMQKLISHSGDIPPDPRDSRGDLPEEISTTTLKLLAKQPRDRYQTPQALKHELVMLAEPSGPEGLMARERGTPKRFRPRFTIRTLTIVVTLVCVYAACWGPTKTWGVRDVATKMQNTRETEPVAPLILTAEHGSWVDVGDQRSVWIRPLSRRRYYFWFFGFVVKLPYERGIHWP